MNKVIAELKGRVAINFERCEDYNISEGIFSCDWAWLKGINELIKVADEDDEDDFDYERKTSIAAKAEGFTNMRVWLDYGPMKSEIDFDRTELIDELDYEDEWKANIILNKELELGMDALWRTNLCEDVIGEILGFL